MTLTRAEHIDLISDMRQLEETYRIDGDLGAAETVRGAIDKARDEQVVGVLQRLPSAEYPPALLQERRQLFVAQVGGGGQARIVYASKDLQQLGGLTERREQILYALEETRLTKAEALPLHEELAEIQAEIDRQ